MKYSNQNNRDFNFYLRSRRLFNFSGTDIPSHVAIYDRNGVDAKRAFFSIENNGKNIPTRHPNVLNALLLAKASVNLNIKMWAESRATGDLPLILFSKRAAIEKYGTIQDCGVDIETELNLPKWVVSAVENQKVKYYA